jgi:ABC-type branched-subunit amino acid transport system ATPase component
VSLIGANGAGKTTTLNAIAGTLGTAGGQILYDGQAIDKLPAHKRLRQGLALVPEGRGIFTRLTVEENLRMGAYCRRDDEAVEADMERIFGMLPRVRERLQQVAGTLSGGEQQMVAIGRALLSRPRLLLLDEPSMGLAPLVVEKIFEVIRLGGRRRRHRAAGGAERHPRPGVFQPGLRDGVGGDHPQRLGRGSAGQSQGAGRLPGGVSTCWRSPCIRADARGLSV